MSQDTGLSIFDAAQKAADASFPLARRGGYDSDAVDAWVRTQSAEFKSAAETVKSLNDENENLRDLIEKLHGPRQPRRTAAGSGRAGGRGRT